MAKPEDLSGRQDIDSNHPDELVIGARLEVEVTNEQIDKLEEFRKKLQQDQDRLQQLPVFALASTQRAVSSLIESTQFTQESTSTILDTLRAGSSIEMQAKIPPVRDLDDFEYAQPSIYIVNRTYKAYPEAHILVEEEVIETLFGKDVYPRPLIEAASHSSSNPIRRHFETPIPYEFFTYPTVVLTHRPSPRAPGNK